MKKKWFYIKVSGRIETEWVCDSAILFTFEEELVNEVKKDPLNQYLNQLIDSKKRGRKLEIEVYELDGKGGKNKRGGLTDQFCD